MLDNMRAWREKTKREARREGLKEGRKVGRKEGRTEGLREALLRLMQRRFGPLPEDVRQRLEAITSTRQLNRLMDKMLTVRSLGELGL